MSSELTGMIAQDTMQNLGEGAGQKLNKQVQTMTFCPFQGGKHLWLMRKSSKQNSIVILV